MGVVIAVVAAIAYALGGVLQHLSISRSSQSAFDAKAIRAGAMKPMWLAGLIIMGVGVGIQLVALSMAELVVVQTIMVSMMVWVLIFAVVIEHVRIGGRELLGSLVLIVGVLLFIVAIQPGPQSTTVDFGGWAIATAVVAVLAVTLTLVARRLPGGPAAALLGTAAGIVNVHGAGLAAAALQEMSDAGVGAMFRSWLPYVAVAVIFASIGLTAMAFAAGPVTAAIPPMIAANPVIGFILGVALLGETLSAGPLGYGLGALSLLIMIGGIAWLSRSKVIAQQFAGV